MQTALSGIWTQIAIFISYNDDCYISVWLQSKYKKTQLQKQRTWKPVKILTVVLETNE